MAKHGPLQQRIIRLDNARHFGPERELSTVDLIVMHASEDKGAGFGSSIDWMNSDRALREGKKLSYNYGIERDGWIKRMLHPSRVAYACGDSGWPNPIVGTPGSKPHGGKSVNRRSLSICWANRDDGEEELTPAQIESAELLVHYWMPKLGLAGIAPSRVRGHNEVSPGRKLDPRAMRMNEFRALLADNVPIRLDGDA